ncbi:DUF6185 family protein [Nonomuraea sp. LP-02]|uniref:DUF6185 family protein n=1 Tax=Nonomuraea sp. LP-02 TaxID=3097960 RepID=UPI002E324554|nr:DUF6185 family protein [Nonomuraea sp. LP-02]MED7928853.1 DUF6185 family protein [Nonomuraea sp. LP-02]
MECVGSHTLEITRRWVTRVLRSTAVARREGNHSVEMPSQPDAVAATRMSTERSLRRRVWGFVLRQLIVALAVTPLVLLSLDLRPPIPAWVRSDDATRRIAILLASAVLLTHGLWAWIGRRTLHSSPRRTRVFRPAGTTLLAVLFAVLIIVPTALVLGRISSTGAPPQEACEPIPAPGARASVKLTLRAERQDMPDFVSMVKLELPHSWALTGALLGHRHTASFQQAIHCLLPREANPVSARDVTVTAGNGQVQVTETVKADVSDAVRGHIGPWSVMPNGSTWRLNLEMSQGPGVGQQQDVEVILPAGWRGESTPPPAQADAWRAAWKLDAWGHMDITVHPDGRARLVAQSGKPPYTLIDWVSYQLCGIAVLAWGYIAIPRRQERRRTCVPTPEPVDQSRVRSYLDLALLLTLLIVVDSLTSELRLLQSMNAGSKYWLSEILTYTVFTALVAVTGRLSPTVVSVLCSITVTCVIVLHDQPESESLTVKTVPLLALMVISTWMAVTGLASALLTATRAPRWRGRPAVSVIFIGTALSVVVLCWYAAIRIMNLYDNSSVANFEAAWTTLSGPITWFPWELANALDDVLWVLPIIALAAVLRKRAALAEPDLDASDRRAVIWIFCVSTLAWEIYVAGLWLPLSVLVAAPVLSITLREARRWVVLRRPQPEHATVVRAGRQALMDLQKTTSGRYENVRAYGPYADAGRNAIFGGRVALMLGLLPSGWFTWLDISSQRGDLDDGWALAVITITGSILGELVLWFVVGFVLGLLWRELPGRISPWKALPLVLAYGAGVLAQVLPDWALGQGPSWWALQRSLFVWAILTIVGFAIELRTWRQISPAPRLAVFYGYQGRFPWIRALAPQILATVFLAYAVLRPEQGFIQLELGQLVRR